MKTYKLVVYVPLEEAAKLRKAMGDAGAGKLGDYSHCSFSSLGLGRFLPLDGAHPTIGKVGEFEKVEEERIETNCDETNVKAVVAAMVKAHPYEEVAYDLFERIEL